VMVRLAEVDVERLAELVTDAWRMRAPAALAGGFGEAGRPQGRPGPRQTTELTDPGR